jgi:hypothetical protein
MSARRDIKLNFKHVTLVAIEGCGSEITLKLRTSRTTKAGTHIFYTISLNVCRWGVKTLLVGLRDMHVRDRERIQRELARIDNEVNALKVTA